MNLGTVFEMNELSSFMTTILRKNIYSKHLHDKIIYRETKWLKSFLNITKKNYKNYRRIPNLDFLPKLRNFIEVEILLT